MIMADANTTINSKTSARRFFNNPSLVIKLFSLFFNLIELTIMNNFCYGYFIKSNAPH